jgi:hypothetical protein
VCLIVCDLATSAFRRSRPEFDGTDKNKIIKCVNYEFSHYINFFSPGFLSPSFVENSLGVHTFTIVGPSFTSIQNKLRCS